MPFLLFGAAAVPAVAATATAPAVAATAATGGLFGTAGAFSLGTAISSVAGIVGTGMALGAGQASDQAAQDAAKQNAANLRAQAAQEELVAKEEQKGIKEDKKRRSSRLRVLAANAGIDMAGTPLLQAEEIAGVFEEERLLAGQAGRQRGFGLETRARQEIQRGKNIRRAGRFRTGTTLLTGVGQLASRFDAA